VSKSRVLVAVVLLLSGTRAAQATPITVPTDSELILNYDLTSSTPAPPYETLDIAVDIGGYTGIVGIGSTPPVSGEVAIPAPEPGTLSLLGLGLAAIARRHRARPASR
jgi:hypothetical protein